jgi:hypothetical protein
MGKGKAVITFSTDPEFVIVVPEASVTGSNRSGLGTGTTVLTNWDGKYWILTKNE